MQGKRNLASAQFHLGLESGGHRDGNQNKYTLCALGMAHERLSFAFLPAPGNRCLERVPHVVTELA